MEALVDDNGRLTAGACVCAFFARFSLQRGRCKHLLALRLASTLTQDRRA